MLHIIKTSPFSTSNLNDCICYVKEHDAILFIQDSVVATASVNKYADRLLGLSRNIKLYTLSEDLVARGLSCQIGSTVDYSGFVELTCEHKQLQSWG